MKTTTKTDQHNSILFEAYLRIDKHVSKKNNIRPRKNASSGRYSVAVDSKTKSELDYLTLKLMGEKAKWRLYEPISCPVSVSFIFHYKKNKNGKATKRFLDQSNAYQGPEDCLQEAGILLDDALIENHDGSARILDAAETALEIVIREFTS